MICAPAPVLSSSFASLPTARSHTLPGAFCVAGFDPPRIHCGRMLLAQENPAGAALASRPGAPIGSAGFSGSTPVRTICGSPLYSAFRRSCESSRSIAASSSSRPSASACPSTACDSSTASQRLRVQTTATNSIGRLCACGTCDHVKLGAASVSAEMAS